MSNQESSGYAFGGITLPHILKVKLREDWYECTRTVASLTFAQPTGDGESSNPVYKIDISQVPEGMDVHLDDPSGMITWDLSAQEGQDGGLYIPSGYILLVSRAQDAFDGHYELLHAGLSCASSESSESEGSASCCDCFHVTVKSGTIPFENPCLMGTIDPTGFYKLAQGKWTKDGAEAPAIDYLFSYEPHVERNPHAYWQIQYLNGENEWCHMIWRHYEEVGHAALNPDCPATGTYVGTGNPSDGENNGTTTELTVVCSDSCGSSSGSGSESEESASGCVEVPNEFAIIQSYKPTYRQVLGHDSDGCLIWIDIGEC